MLFLFKELYIVLLIEQYWSYINSSISASTAKKINGPITGIAGIGGAVGGTLVAMSAESLGNRVHGTRWPRLHSSPRRSSLTWPTVSSGNPSTTAEIRVPWVTWRLSLFRENPVLVSLLAIVLSSQVIAAVLDFKFQSLLSVEFAGNPDKETAFQGWFWGTLNTSVLAFQFVITPLLSVFRCRSLGPPDAAADSSGGYRRSDN